MTDKELKDFLIVTTELFAVTNNIENIVEYNSTDVLENYLQGDLKLDYDVDSKKLIEFAKNFEYLYICLISNTFKKANNIEELRKMVIENENVLNEFIKKSKELQSKLNIYFTKQRNSGEPL